MTKGQQIACQRAEFAAASSEGLPTTRTGAVVTRSESQRMSEWLRNREPFALSIWRRRKPMKGAAL